MAASTITDGFSIAGGLQLDAWLTITDGYYIGPEVDVDYGTIGFLCPAGRLEVLSTSTRVDFRTPARRLEAERPGD